MRSRVQRARVGHDRWLVSYADFITLLFAFFVVLYAFARADQKKQIQVAQAINKALHTNGGTSSLDRPDDAQNSAQPASPREASREQACRVPHHHAVPDDSRCGECH